MPNDNTKYLFNDTNYGKGRLVHAVVKQYIENEQPTIEQLRVAFPKKLQGSFGVFYTGHEYDKRKKSSNDKTERFFIKAEDLLIIDGDKILICTEWGKGNIELFVEHAITLGFDIKMDSQVLSDEEVIKQFIHKPAFKKNYQAWSDDVLKTFCDFMRYTHQSGLDIYTNKMKTGDSIRIGRKGNTHQIAKEVFTTIEPCKNKVNYAQRYKHRDDYLTYELDNDALTELIAVGDMAAFNKEHPVTRTPYWPSDYSEPALSDVEANIWKVSLSPSTFNKEELVWLEQNQVITVHKNTGNGSANNFRDIKIGDIVSIGHGNTVFRLVKVISDITSESDSPFNDEWLMRKYELIKGLEKPVKYKGENKRWSPRYPGTSWQVPKKEFRMFEREILKPYYQLTLEELGFDTNQLSNPEAENKKVQAMKNTPLNQILYGPPGTGKTYHSIQVAVKAAEPEVYCELGINEKVGATAEQRTALTQLYKELFDAGRIRFVTFHQSYGYEEFVEGLSAKTEGDQLSYYEKDGVFKAICNEAKSNFEDSQKSEAELTDYQEFNEALEDFKLTMFDESDAYELTEAVSITSIEDSGFRYSGESWKSSQIMKFEDLKSLYLEGVETRQGIKKSKRVSGLAKQHASYFIRALEAIKERLQQVTADYVVPEKQNFVLIIDEINRGNISKIFGELITLIEPSKRLGQKESLEVVLPYSGDKFSVPDNLYIIGTMNTADRSLALMDTALRRRFDFVEMMPDYSVLTDDENQPYCINHLENELDLVELLSTLNKRISALYDREHTLGHAFLMPVVDKIKSNDHQGALTELAICFQNKLIPLLAEYFFEDWQKIRLVLADNQKPKGLQLIQETDVDLEGLFGDTEEVDVLDDELNDYQLIKADSKLWRDSLTYIGIYQPSALGE